MWNASALEASIPADLLTRNRYTLSDDIYAMQLLAGSGASVTLGPVVLLPKGVCLYVCGEGFNERTVKVYCEDSLYFVFLQDLEVQRKPMAPLVGADAFG